MKKIMRRVNNLSTRQVLAILVGIAVLSAVFSALKSPNGLTDEWWSGFAQNFSTEMFGAIATFVLIELIIGNRQEKERLIIQMRSKDNATALQAVEELRENGWLKDGSLQGAQLEGADLQGARLEGVNLQGVVLRASNLQGARLEGVNLQGAVLRASNLQGARLEGVNLQGAVLTDANLRGTHLWGANLEKAYLTGANLQRANLESANLQGADFQHADLQGTVLTGADLKGAHMETQGFIPLFSETTTLPDGRQWKPDTDMTRFTDPNHPDFWRSGNPHSPAYRGSGNSEEAK